MPTDEQNGYRPKRVAIAVAGTLAFIVWLVGAFLTNGALVGLTLLAGLIGCGIFVLGVLAYRTYRWTRGEKFMGEW
jgi:hypothetical protein